MKNWTVNFYTVDSAPKIREDSFGASVSYTIPASPGFPLQGEVLSGSYEKVLCQLEALSAKNPIPAFKACIVLFRRNVGQESFLRQIGALLPTCRFAGGTAAFDSQNPSFLLPVNEEVSLMLLTNEVEQDTVNLHSPSHEVSITLQDNIVTHIDHTPALEYLQNFAASKGFDRLCLEQVTLSDINGKNIHFDISPTGIKANASFETTTKACVRYIDMSAFKNAVNAFTSAENSIIFGCAGLHSLVDFELTLGRGSIIGFFHGEVISTPAPAFANLMMTRFRIL